MGLKDKLKNLGDKVGGKEGLKDKLRNLKDRDTKDKLHNFWKDRKNGRGSQDKNNIFLVVLLLILVGLAAFLLLDQQQESIEAIATDQHQESRESSKVERKRHGYEHNVQEDEEAQLGKIEEEEKDNLKEHREGLKEEKEEPKEENASQNVEEAERALALIETEIDGYRSDKNKAIEDDDYNEARRLKAVIEDLGKKAQKLKTIIASKTPQGAEL